MAIERKNKAKLTPFVPPDMNVMPRRTPFA